MAQPSPPAGRDNHEQRRTPRTLAEFRLQEGRENRKRRLLALWRHIRVRGYNFDREPSAKALGKAPDSTENAKKLRAAYEHELLGRVGGWKQFVEYAEAKEVELWTIFHDELDLDRNGHLEPEELELALRKAGITLSPNTLSEFMTYLTTSPQSRIVTFAEFRDFLLLLPRKISTTEIYKYYEMNKFLGDDGKGVARVTMEGDVSLSAEDKPPDGPSKTVPTTQAPAIPQPLPPVQSTYVEHEEEQEDDDDDAFDDSHGWLEGRTALKFLLAGGIAGAVSRTCTAPFDRLKIFLITRPPDLGGASRAQAGGANVLGYAVRRIYSEGGVFAFWTGNGLSVAKIFPESAIKFFAYESAKRMFATYWDHVDDPREISGVSRFLSGGIGGISSQLCIYPVETLKTQMMSNTGTRRTLMSAARHVWKLGGFRAYYRGLTVGLVGVFPYSAIDMSTFEALKLAYLRSTGKDEPGMLALLAFGSVSGSVGATSVYPMNLVRTRLQASGSSGHPERYTGVFDVASKTWAREGWRGFYRGLFPTLAKVVPAVSISYVVYEHSKRRLGV